MVGGGKLDVAGSRDVLGQVAAVSYPDVGVVSRVDHQGRHSEIAEQRPHIAVHQHSPDRRSHGRACSSMAGTTPPCPERVVVGQARGHQRDVVGRRHLGVDKPFGE